MTPKVFLFPWYCRLIGLAVVLLMAVLIGLLVGQAPDAAGWAALLQNPELTRYAAMLMPGLFLIAFSRERLEDEYLNAVRLSAIFTSLALHAVYFLVFSFTDFTVALVNFPALLLMDSVLLVYIVVYYIRKR